MSQLTRRNLTTFAAALPVLALPVAVAATTPDPVFAAIDRHSQAWAAITTTADELMTAEERRQGVPEARARLNAACDTATEALEALAKTVPTSLSGMQAVLEYWWEHYEIGMGEACLSDEMRVSMELLRSMHAAAGNLAAG